MSVIRMGSSMCRLETGKLLRGMLAHPFEGRPRYPTPGGCGGEFPGTGSIQTRLLAFREEPSHTFTQHGCAFFTSLGR